MLREKLRGETLKYRFSLEPEEWHTVVNVKLHPLALGKTKFKCKMNQFPVHCNDATTGHKLQGMSKDAIIITLWPRGELFENWEYVVLSRVRTWEGLYLFEPIDMTKSFKPSEELALFLKRENKNKLHFWNSEQGSLKIFKKIIETLMWVMKHFLIMFFARWKFATCNFLTHIDDFWPSLLFFIGWKFTTSIFQLTLSCFGWSEIVYICSNRLKWPKTGKIKTCFISNTAKNVSSADSKCEY